MLVRQLHLLFAGKSKGVFRHHIGILRPIAQILFGKNIRRNTADRFECYDIAGVNTALLINFTPGGLQRCFILFTAAGNKLPLIKIRTMENTVRRRMAG